MFRGSAAVIEHPLQVLLFHWIERQTLFSEILERKIASQLRIWSKVLNVREELSSNSSALNRSPTYEYKAVYLIRWTQGRVFHFRG